MKVGQRQLVKGRDGEWVAESESLADNTPPKPKVKAKVEPAEFIPIVAGVWTIASVDVVKGFPTTDKVTGEQTYMRLTIPIVKVTVTRANWDGKAIVVTRSKGGISLAYPNGDKTATMGPSAAIKTIKAKFGDDMGRHILDICDVAPPLPTPEKQVWASYRTENVRLRAADNVPLNGQEGKRAHNRPLVPVIHPAPEPWKTGERLAELRYQATIVDKVTGQTRNGSFEASSMDDVLSTLADEGWTLVDGPSIRTETLTRGTETLTVEYL